MSAARYQVAVLIALLAFAPVEAQDASTAAATVAPAASAASAAAQPATLWRFLGIPQGFQKVRDVVANRRGNRPRMERKDPIKRIADPANLESDNPAIKAAAEIKKAEDMKLQKIKAIKYLATIGCGCYDKDGKITEALIAATDDCTPDVREEAIKAIDEASSGECCPKCGSTSCCNEKITKRLSEIAYERDDSGCPIEPNAEIRKLAKRVLCKCCPGRPLGPIEEEAPEPDPEPEPVPAPEPDPEPEPPKPEISGESSEESSDVSGESGSDDGDAMDDFGDPDSSDSLESPFEDDPDNAALRDFDSIDSVRRTIDSPTHVRFHIDDRTDETHPQLAPVLTAPEASTELAPVQTIRIQPKPIQVQSTPIQIQPKPIQIQPKPIQIQPKNVPSRPASETAFGHESTRPSGPSWSDGEAAVSIAKIPEKLIPDTKRELITAAKAQATQAASPPTLPERLHKKSNMPVAQAMNVRVDPAPPTTLTNPFVKASPIQDPLRVNLLQASSVEPLETRKQAAGVRPLVSIPAKASPVETQPAATRTIPKGMRRPIVAEVISVNFDTGIVVMQCDQTSLVRVAMRGSLYGGMAGGRDLLTHVSVVSADDVFVRAKVTKLSAASDIRLGDRVIFQ